MPEPTNQISTEIQVKKTKNNRGNVSTNLGLLILIVKQVKRDPKNGINRQKQAKGDIEFGSILSFFPVISLYIP